MDAHTLRVYLNPLCVYPNAPCVDLNPSRADIPLKGVSPCPNLIGSSANKRQDGLFLRALRERERRTGTVGADLLGGDSVRGA